MSKFTGKYFFFQVIYIECNGITEKVMSRLRETWRKENIKNEKEYSHMSLKSWHAHF